MGQTLSSPSTKKTYEAGSSVRFVYGIAEMQGWRITMEDSHAAVLDLDGSEEGSNAFFAVYDGHGGSTVARYAGQNVHKRLITEESYKEQNWEMALKKAFLGTDEDLLANPAHTRDPSGCTAVAALITSDNKIYVANAGDSRSVLSVMGEAKPLSFDHKPTNIGERTRILGAGGYVECGRVNGNLALSRALGDFEFKKNYNLGPEAQIITSNPEVTCHEITKEDEFLIIACDGIWDCLSSQQVVDFVRYQVSEGKELTEIGEMMCDHCLAPDTISGAGIGCDNMTVLVVAITHGRTKEEWYEWVKGRVKSDYGHKTVGTPPQLYSESRLLSFRARREAMEARERMAAAQVNNQTSNSNRDEFLQRHGITVTTISISSNGGISYQPGGNIVNDSGKVMFGSDDLDEDDDEETADGSSYFADTFRLGSPEPPDPVESLREQLAEFEKEEESTIDIDGDANMHLKASEKPTEMLSLPIKLPNGDVTGTPEPVNLDLQEIPSPSHGEVPEPVKA
eukprot:GHVU01063409.1.p1 GENE.GHVU01063409.1~~GHVU01063409.1.p1  ORF type:complete len:510 (-),score=57.80 GHVU01063409.1:287-1816(-)